MRSAINPLAFTREQVALCHAGLVVIAASWLFGGIGQTFEWIVAVLAAPSFILLFAEGRNRLHIHDRSGFRRLLRWFAPLALLALYVVVSALNASHHPAFLYNIYVLRPIPHLEWLPSSARPLESLRLLACLGGLAATGLSLTFCTRSRRAIRALLLVIALNTLALAVLGTIQKQTGSSGPLFGLVTSPNSFWFSTFLYHNHWGAFVVLTTSLALGLVFQSLRQPSKRGWWHSPGPLVALVAVLVAATAPLSGSRSATILVIVLLIGAGLLAIPRPRSRSRSRKRQSLGALSVLIGAAALLVGLVSFQSRAVISARSQTTLDQITMLRTGAVGYSRADLYADTWRMAEAKPLFGWGLESYAPIFLQYCRFKPGPDGLMNTFEDAHSDWLQSLAELGFIGTSLLISFAVIPLVETFRRCRRPGSVESWLLAGCTLVVLYACVEFPFANPAVVALWWVAWFAALRCQQLGSGDRPTRSDTACSPSSS